MKTVIELIKKKANNQVNNPFIQWLKDESVPAKERLSLWYYTCGRFAFDFADFQNMILRYPEAEAAQDRLKQAINNHTYEDGKHWQLYLVDLKKLGLDGQISFSDALKFLWGKDTYYQRYAAYRFCQLASENKDPILRYCIIQSIETFGHFLFGILVKVSAMFQEETAIELQYLGLTHLNKETGTLANQQDDTEKELWKITLDDKTREKALSISSEVCELIEMRWQEFYQVSQKKRQVGTSGDTFML